MPPFYTGETFRFLARLKDADGAVWPLDGATGEGRMVEAGVALAFPAQIDVATGEVLVVVDRTDTADWKPGVKTMQIWVDFGEGSPIEAQMIQALTFAVKAKV